ncbi:hypothetical protein FBEOM_11059 [Fusarium beomiforme]|uniref:Protein kinase domain-containing protein n=1 Tax=Fusarium beomiforme TaxID=44412 RepID=A0A9P5DS18_9HYPO|nr:hypothetical protein FBEOM_11059 [Fusarium beomiforme]
MPTLKPLPDCEGPKLECFTDDLTKHDFKFLEYLGEGCHSAVVKAEIDGKVYVIKFFFPMEPVEQTIQMVPIDENFMVDADVCELLTASDKMPQHVTDIVRLQATSFYNECRAYGRLKETGREDLAIKAHGYLRVNLHQIDEHFQAAIQDAYPGDRPSTRGDIRRLFKIYDDLDVDVPIMATVKDWVPNH